GESILGTGEFIIGKEHTGSHACYLIYGKMAPGETGRVLKPGRGHEEIFFPISGEFRLVSKDEEMVVKVGSAVHLIGEEEFVAENISGEEAVYVMAGGHSDGGHH
ncbi:MAG: hypothetical protein D6726_12760, partial [Nitrospirae bacterium]